MRFLLLRSGFALSVFLAGTASAVTIDWVPVGNPGNPADDTGYGAVGYAYQIDKYEVTNAQYAEFLNAKAASDPLGLYNTNMGSSIYGGITQSCTPSCTYSVISGRGNMPVNYVSFYDALRFANWLNNGQAGGDTETGAYTLEGGTATPSNGTIVTRNAGATIFLTSEDEWYKAAYHSTGGTYFDYPAGSDTETTCAFPPLASSNMANCDDGSDYGIADVGSYTGSPSPYVTFDQGGNVWEWNDTIIVGSARGVRAGSFGGGPTLLAASTRTYTAPANETDSIGFRVAPEPTNGLLVGVAGLLGLAGWRRRRA